MSDNFQNENTPQAPLDRGDYPQPSQLGKGQKIAVGVLAVFAVFVMVFWATQFKRSITEPLAYKGSGDNNTNNADASINELTDEEKKAKDTDKDGLNDWEEENIYKTSAYLDDSDSDGYKDKEEIDNGNDPICPVGRDCYGPTVSDIVENPASEEETGEGSTANEDLLNALLEQTNNQKETDAGNDLTQEETEVLNNLLSGKASVSEIREMLKAYGMDQSIIDKLSDEQIMKMYQETLLNQE